MSPNMLVGPEEGVLPQALRIVITVALPFVIVLSNVRLVLLPWFPVFEYSRNGFPSDPYGMTIDERRVHARRAVDYLLNGDGIEFLAEQRFADGTSLYNERALRHMQDVKVVVGVVLWVWRVATILAIISGLVLVRDPGTRSLLRGALMIGATIVVVILLGLLLYIMLNFNSFFTNFHRVFFESGTWTFSYSDTLIRLFPLRFWSDVALLISGASLLEGFLVLLWTRFFYW